MWILSLIHIFFGQGYMQGTQTQAGEGSLPARHTDFIFCVCGEELGMIGCLVVIALLAAIIIRAVSYTHLDVYKRQL